MKSKRFHISLLTATLVLAFIAVCFNSCGFFPKPDTPLVGTWALLGGDTTLVFKNGYKFSTKQHNVTIQENKEPHYYHYSETFNGSYEIKDNILTLHYKNGTYKSNDDGYIEHPFENFQSYDENIWFEISRKSTMTCIRNYGTDSAYTQTYQKQYIK